MARKDIERETPGGRGGSFRGGEIQFRDLCGKCGARRIDRQIGLEESPDAWAARLVKVFREVRRVLRPDGVCFVNVGDSYSTGSSGDRRMGDPNNAKAGGAAHWRSRARQPCPGMKPKDLVGAPWLLAFALRADGWWLRSEIIWAKPNPMPESVTDRCTKSHEQMFMLAKSGETTFWLHRDLPGVRSRPKPDYRWIHKETGEEVAEDPGDPENWNRINLWRGRDYFYDAEAVRETATCTARPETSRIDGNDKYAAGSEYCSERSSLGWNRPENGRNARSVWTIATEAFSESHFATMPTELARRCILAGTSAKGCCPQCGAPWARVVRQGLPASERANGSVYTGAAYAQPQSAPRGPKSNFGETKRSTLGWRPSCQCCRKCDDPVPATVLDPFGGSGTTGLVADQLGRDAVLIELSPDYCTMAERRIANARARRLLGEDAPRQEILPGQIDLFGVSAKC